MNVLDLNYLNIRPTTLKLLVYLNAKCPIEVSYLEIRDHTGLCTGTISQGIKELFKFNVIRYDKGKSYKRASTYFLNEVKDWKL